MARAGPGREVVLAWYASRTGSLREAVAAPDTQMWCPVCDEPCASEAAFDRHYRRNHRKADQK
jgi:hypothetical protein